jgi:hypothetical protein
MAHGTHKSTFAGVPAGPMGPVPARPDGRAGTAAAVRWWLSLEKGRAMKKVLELICCVLHPVAVVLIWVYLLLGRGRFGLIARLAWGVAVIVPFVPFLYVLTGNDFL